MFLFIDIGLWLELSGVFVIIVLKLVFFELVGDLFRVWWFFFWGFKRVWDLLIGILI